jgi:peptide/nickel transport system permease protein
MNALAMFWGRRANRLALGLLCAFALVALGAPWLAPQPDPQHPGPYKIVGPTTDGVPHPPNLASPLGTSPGQADVYFTIVWGTRTAFVFGLAVALCTGVLGVALGLFSGYLGGRAGGLVVRISDAFLSFPAIAGVWLFAQVIVDPTFTTTMFEFEPTWFQVTSFNMHITPLMLGLVAFSWMPYTRLTHTQILLIKDLEYIVAARAVGVRPLRLVLRHMLPNVLTPVLVLLARDVGGMVVLGAALTYIGFEGGSEWGALIVAGRDWIIGPGGNPLAFWWVYLPATLALVLFGAGWSLLGDGLNTALNPHGG